MSFGVAHETFSDCSIKARTLNVYFPAPFDGTPVLNRDNIKPYINPEGQPLWDLLAISRTSVGLKTGYSKIRRLC